MALIINSFVSGLDTPTSLLPFFVKDSFDVTGRTIMAGTEGGRHEAREKFIEEAGTSLFWIGGIPAARWVISKITKSISKINPDIHFKRINSNSIQNYFADEIEINGKKKYSPEELKGVVLKGGKLDKIKNNLLKEKYIPNVSKGLYGKFHLGLTAFAVVSNLAMLCIAVPKANQLLSRIIISKEEKQKEQLNKTTISAQNNNTEQKVTPQSQNKPQIQTNLKETSKKPVSFGSLRDLTDFKSLFNLTKMAEETQLNVTNSMLLLDYGISGSRVTFIPRNNNERVENAIKEGGIIFFFYYAADYIKKGFQFIADKAFKTPIDLDYKILKDKDFAQSITNDKNKDELFKFTEKNEELDIIKFIDKELETVPENVKKEEVFKNFTLKMAQKIGLIDVEFDKELNRWTRHSEKFIDTDKLTQLNGNLKNFWGKAIKNGEKNLEKAIKTTQHAKEFSILGNIALCCFSLSFLLPKIQYFVREHRTNTKQAPGIKFYQELAEEHVI